MCLSQYFHCEHCGKSFVTKHKLKGHMGRVHTADADKPFCCEDCGLGFMQKHLLEAHRIKKHIKNTPFKCRYGCDAAYNSHTSRTKHEVKKHGRKRKSRKRLGEAGGGKAIRVGNCD